MSIRVEHASGTIIDDFKKHKIPTPAPDGTEVVFTTPDEYISGTLEVFRDQSVLLKAVDFTETTSTTFTVTSAPDADEVLWVCYVKV